MCHLCVSTIVPTILILGIVLYSTNKKKLEYFVFEYDLTRTIEVSILSQNKSFARFSKISPTFFGIYWCILTFRLGLIVFFVLTK